MATGIKHALVVNRNWTYKHKTTLLEYKGLMQCTRFTMKNLSYTKDHGISMATVFTGEDNFCYHGYINHTFISGQIEFNLQNIKLHFLS